MPEAYYYMVVDTVLRTLLTLLKAASGASGLASGWGSMVTTSIGRCGRVAVRVASRGRPFDCDTGRCPCTTCARCAGPIASDTGPGGSCSFSTSGASLVTIRLYSCLQNYFLIWYMHMFIYHCFFLAN